MITIGITGGMGSGKSYVSKAFSKQGIPVYDSDQKTKDLLNENEELKKEIISKYGSKCYKDGKWNRDHVVKLASTDGSVLTGIGTIIEPYLAKDFKEYKEVFSGSHTGYTIDLIAIESAILTKSKMLMSEVDKILVVDAPFETRISRIKARDPFRSDEEIKLLLSKQILPPLCQTDYSIMNDGTKNIDDLVKKIIELQ
jgi:dephospho-CoA kinase